LPPPDHLPALAVDLVDGTGRAGGDEQVILVIHVYGVDVEVVVGLGVRLVEADVLQAVPLEYDLAGLDVELLDYPVEHNTVYRIDHRNEVPWHLVVDRDQGRIFGRDEELVVVPVISVAGPDPRHLPVGAVRDHVLPLAVSCVLPLPPSEYLTAAVALQLEVHRVHRLTLHGPEPHGLASVVEDQAAVLARTRFLRAILGGAKYVARGRVVRLRGHLQDGRLEVGPRAKGPSVSRAGGGSACVGGLYRLAAQGAR
jgi:hypothetical protein